MARFVDEFDSIDAAGTARGAADLVHQLEQYGRIRDLSEFVAWLHDEMQHHETLLGEALSGNGKQTLYSLDIADPNSQATVLFVDLGDTVGFDRVLYAVAHTMLIHVEEQQLFQCAALFHAQFRRNGDWRNGDWIVQRPSSSIKRRGIMTAFTTLCGESQKRFGAPQQWLSVFADAVSYSAACADIQARPDISSLDCCKTDSVGA
jgi:hypothetical protein